MIQSIVFKEASRKIMKYLNGKKKKYSRKINDITIFKEFLLFIISNQKQFFHI